MEREPSASGFRHGEADIQIFGTGQALVGVREGGEPLRSCTAAE